VSPIEGWVTNSASLGLSLPSWLLSGLAYSGSARIHLDSAPWCFFRNSINL
jgi:hypothetical protein